MVTVPTTLVLCNLSSLSSPTKLSHFQTLAISHQTGKALQDIPEHFNTEKHLITQLKVNKVPPGINLSVPLVYSKFILGFPSYSIHPFAYSPSEILHTLQAAFSLKPQSTMLSAKQAFWILG